MEFLRLSKPDRSLRGDIVLDGSKSISNRALIVLALAGADPAAHLANLSSSKDTRTLQRLLTQTDGAYDAGDAGTTFRFLTAYLAIQPGVQVLDGSARMRERPVGGLVAALRTIGANIEYLEQEGYPPLKIGEMQHAGADRKTVRISAGTSSQFLSALLLIGPHLPGGLELIPTGRLVSRPYLDMTLKLMRYFGAQADWKGDSIVVEPGQYHARAFTIEADWSAASYWYAMAAFAGDVDLYLHGLFTDSWQGDSMLIDMMRQFGVHTAKPSEAGTALRLSKTGAAPTPEFRRDFTECPDIAQTLAVVCAGLGINGLFSGLETLYVKETDRIAALQHELAKIGVGFVEQPGSTPEKVFFRTAGKVQWPQMPRFATYGDHRMAMSFAPLALFHPLEIENPSVVAKSYPAFWDHLRAAGFEAAGVFQ
jgi:3-phosphoshikimate 1-carboxyvinyltransferase